jgi:hypothetical protein
MSGKAGIDGVSEVRLVLKNLLFIAVKQVT